MPRRVFLLRRVIVFAGMFALGCVFMRLGMMRMMMPRMRRRAPAAGRVVIWMLRIVVVACHALMGAPRPAMSASLAAA